MPLARQVQGSWFKVQSRDDRGRRREGGRARLGFSASRDGTTLGRQFKPKGAAGSQLRFDACGAAEPFQGLGNDGQSDARALLFIEGIQAFENPEHALMVAGV